MNAPTVPVADPLNYNPSTAEGHLKLAAHFLEEYDCRKPYNSCDYDNVCFAHKARWHVGEALKLITTGDHA